MKDLTDITIDNVSDIISSYDGKVVGFKDGYAILIDDHEYTYGENTNFDILTFIRAIHKTYKDADNISKYINIINMTNDMLYKIFDVLTLLTATDRNEVSKIYVDMGAVNKLIEDVNISIGINKLEHVTTVPTINQYTINVMLYIFKSCGYKVTLSDRRVVSGYVDKVLCLTITFKGKKDAS